MDHFSGYLLAFPLKKQDASTVAEVLVNNVFMKFGIPEAILSDQGKNFMSSLLEEIYAKLDVKRLRTTTYHPQTNGKLERIHRDLKAALAKFIQKNHRHWHLYLPFIVYSLNNSPNKATGETPFYLMFHRDGKFPHEVIFGRHTTEEDYSWFHIEDYVGRVSYGVKKAREEAARRTEEYHRYQKQYYDRQAELQHFNMGDRVWCRRVVPLQGISSRLQSEYEGPYTITKICSDYNYIITDEETGKQKKVHVNLLKPVPESCWQYNGEDKPAAKSTVKHTQPQLELSRSSLLESPLYVPVSPPAAESQPTIEISQLPDSQLEKGTTEEATVTTAPQAATDESATVTIAQPEEAFESFSEEQPVASPTPSPPILSPMISTPVRPVITQQPRSAGSPFPVPQPEARRTARDRKPTKLFGDVIKY